MTRPTQAGPEQIDPTVQSPFEHELATVIVAALHLETTPVEIAPDATLFGEGLGLDSIDALEMALAISREYGLELKSDDERTRSVFTSLRTLARHVESHRVR